MQQRTIDESLRQITKQAEMLFFIDDPKQDQIDADLPPKRNQSQKIEFKDIEE